MDLLLNSLSIKHYFDIIISAGEVENGKPSPDVFLIVANKLHLKPENCVVIEDAPVGIQAANRAGMKCIALTTTHDKKELTNADLVIEDLSQITLMEIIQLIKKNEKS